MRRGSKENDVFNYQFAVLAVGHPVLYRADTGSFPVAGQEESRFGDTCGLFLHVGCFRNRYDSGGAVGAVS